MAVNTDEASLACLLLTSCCVARFLTGHRHRYPSVARVLGPPVLEYISTDGEGASREGEVEDSQEKGG